MRRMIVTVAGLAMLVVPSATLMAAPVAEHGKIIQVHTGRGKSAVRAGGRQYRSYSVQPMPRTYRAPAQPSGDRVIQSAPMAAPLRGVPQQALPTAPVRVN